MGVVLAALEGAIDALQSLLSGQSFSGEACGHRSGSGGVVIDRATMQRMTRVSQRVEATRLRMIGLADAAGVPERQGFTDAGSWVSATTQTDRRAAAGDAQLAGDLAAADAQAAQRARADQAAAGTGPDGLDGADGPGASDGSAPPPVSGLETAGAGNVTGTVHSPVTRSPISQALEAGWISMGHAKVMFRALRDLPESITDEQRRNCETELLRLATRVTPARLRRAAERLLVVTGAAPAVVDAHQNETIAATEERAWQASAFWLRDNSDGTMTGHFTVPWLAGAALKKILDAMTAPRRTGGHTTWATTTHPTPSFAGRPTAGQSATAQGAGAHASAGQGAAPGAGAHVGADQGATAQGAGGRDAIGQGAGGQEARPFSWQHDQLDWQQRRGQAFAELLLHLPTDHLHNKTAATILVTTTLAALRGELSQAGTTDLGENASAGNIRRLACGAGIIPVVLGADSVPLDLGRQTRCFTEHQRAALATHYTECAAHGCDRPFAWSEIHHLQPWSHGGSTNLTNAIPLCATHHRWIDRGDTQHRVRRCDDGTITIHFHRRT